MKRFCLVLICAGFAWTLQAQSKKILWIGNSYVGTNNLPQLFYNLALSAGDTVIFDSNTPGGFTLSAHAGNANTLQKIAQPGWDYVIIQAQSQEPSFPPQQVENQTLPYAIELDSLIHAANPCAKTVFYMTWGRRYGDQQNCSNYPPLCTFEGMTLRLRWGYKLMADATQSMIAPAGMAWKASVEADSSLVLWSGDNSHPSVAGSYLTACTIYTTIFRKPSSGLSFNAGLNTASAQFLQGIADATVNDSLEVWNIGTFEPQSGMSYISNGPEISFQQECLNSNTYSWDFGDGTVSNLPNPVHVYTAPGNYVVRLIAGDGCSFDTTSQTIEVMVTTIKPEDTDYWRIFPNPAGNDVIIQSVSFDRFHIVVYSAKGELVKVFDQEGTYIKLDFSDLPTGVYQIACSTKNNQKIFRILKD